MPKPIGARNDLLNGRLSSLLNAAGRKDMQSVRAYGRDLRTLINSGPHTWTPFTFTCAQCKQLCYASREAIESTRENDLPDTYTDAEIAGSYEYCLRCCNGEETIGEQVDIGSNPDAPWQLPPLTPNQIFAIDEALAFSIQEDAEIGNAGEALCVIAPFAAALRTLRNEG